MLFSRAYFFCKCCFVGHLTIPAWPISELGILQPALAPCLGESVTLTFLSISLLLEGVSFSLLTLYNYICISCISSPVFPPQGCLACQGSSGGTQTSTKSSNSSRTPTQSSRSSSSSRSPSSPRTFPNQSHLAGECRGVPAAPVLHGRPCQGQDSAAGGYPAAGGAPQP